MDLTESLRSGIKSWGTSVEVSVEGTSPRVTLPKKTRKLPNPEIVEGERNGKREGASSFRKGKEERKKMHRENEKDCERRSVGGGFNFLKHHGFRILTAFRILQKGIERYRQIR